MLPRIEKRACGWAMVRWRGYYTVVPLPWVNDVGSLPHLKWDTKRRTEKELESIAFGTHKSKRSLG